MAAASPNALTGAAKCNAQGVCNLGDPDGGGEANLVVNVGQQRICYGLTAYVRLSRWRGARAVVHTGPALIASA